MLKKFVSTMFICVMLAFGSVVMADTVVGDDVNKLTSDEIIIAEPVQDKVFNDKSLFITVNIIDAEYFTKLAEQPLTISLVKLEDALPFADELGSDLQVPVVKLSSSAARAWISSTGMILDDYTPVEGSKYAAETAIINKYFKSLEEIDALSLRITTAVNKYKFGTYIHSEADLALVSEEMKTAYSQYLSDASALSEKKKAFAEIQRQYLQLFEVSYLKDTINTPSYLKDIGTLNPGNYRIRIYDESRMVIKEFNFKVITREDAIKTMITEPIR